MVVEKPVTVVLRSTELGTGMPALCVPVVGATVTDLLDHVASLPTDRIDLVELRIDYFAEVADPEAVRAAVAAVREKLPDTLPLLFTFRSKREGGEQEFSTDAYEKLLLSVIADAVVDAVDVEMFTDRPVVERVVAAAHDAGIPVVMSNHDFGATPPRDEIVSRLRAQQDLGADVVKVAVMPLSARDVVTLLDATVEYRTTPDARPTITMSMKGLGVISRIAGETFGSCVTFGAVGTPSAPGQIAVEDLRGMLTVLHNQA